MAGPLVGISAAQIAQQKLQDQGTQQQLKQGPSKFDQAMKTQAPSSAEAVQQANAAQKAQAAQGAQKVDQTRQVDTVGKTEKAALNKVNTAQTAKAADPVSHKSEVSKSTNVMAHMISDMEKGQGVMDKLINAGVSGKNFSSSQLLSLQAGMYKYTQELELTGKVVEKATSGLKDTLKTQV